VDEETLVRRAGRMIETELDGELIGLEIDRGTCFGFNATATRIWALIEQPKRFGELTDTLVGEYEVDADTCRSELAALLATLERSGLVEIEAAPA
jgi:Coenzyme PQQ synthesis protein D (PqqD)